MSVLAFWTMFFAIIFVLGVVVYLAMSDYNKNYRHRESTVDRIGRLQLHDHLQRTTDRYYDQYDRWD